MNDSSFSTSNSLDELVIQILNTTKKDLRKLKQTNPKLFAEFLDILRSSQLEAKRVLSVSKIAIDRINSL